MSGVFVGGQRPLWLVADRGRLLPHPATADGAAPAFTPFHNDLCQSVRPPPRRVQGGSAQRDSIMTWPTGWLSSGCSTSAVIQQFRYLMYLLPNQLAVNVHADMSDHAIKSGHFLRLQLPGMICIL